MEFGVQNYNLSPDVRKLISEKFGQSVAVQVADTLPGSQIYVPGLGGYDVTTYQRLHKALFGFYVVRDENLDGLRVIESEEGSFLISDTALIITAKCSVNPSIE